MLVLFAAALPARLRAQFMRDPLTPADAAQVRDTSVRLDKRIPLLLGFAEDRLTRFEQLRTATPRPPDRGAHLYALLRQYAEILPEADDAIGDLASGVTSSESPKKYNVPKALDPAIVQLQHLRAMLQQIRQASSPSDLANYHFELQNCLDVTSDSLQNAQQDRNAAQRK